MGGHDRVTFGLAGIWTDGNANAIYLHDFCRLDDGYGIPTDVLDASSVRCATAFLTVPLSLRQASRWPIYSSTCRHRVRFRPSNTMAMTDRRHGSSSSSPLTGLSIAADFALFYSGQWSDIY
jgi:hypothetical protein